MYEVGDDCVKMKSFTVHTQLPLPDVLQLMMIIDHDLDNERTSILSHHQIN